MYVEFNLIQSLMTDLPGNTDYIPKIIFQIYDAVNRKTTSVEDVA